MRAVLVIVGLVLALATSARAAGSKPWDFVVSPPTAVEPLAGSEKPRSMALVRVFVDMGEDREWASVYWCCNTIGRDIIAWKGSRSDIKVDDLAHEFDAELGDAGFSSGAKTRLFAADSDSELQIGAVVGDLAARLCSGCGVTTPDDYFKGAAFMTVEWQVYSPRDRKVVLIVKTAGSYEATTSRPGLTHILNGAFRENARKLLNAPEFRKLATSPVQAATVEEASPSGSAPLAIAGAAYPSRAIRDVVNSVVAVFGNAGMGSGFLISQDGYILTNQHVVGEAKFVKVKWSDGSEGLGEVVRTDRRRDVALVKTEPTRHLPVALRTDEASLGATVYAIGTPLDERYQNTLTKGIISGARVLDGLRFIQSDVAIDHGNSGGPLLDEAGRAVALAVSRDEREGVGHNINFFIPVGEALRALNLTIAPTPPNRAAARPPTAASRRR